MLARRLEGLIIASTQWTVESFHIIEEQQRRYVFVDRRFSGLAANFVGTYDLAIGRIATEHLIQNGWRRIAYIGGEHVSTAIDRVEGYRGALGLAGLATPSEYVLQRRHYDDSGDVTGYKAAKELFALAVRPDGIFCHNNPIALGAMEPILDQVSASRKMTASLEQAISIMPLCACRSVVLIRTACSWEAEPLNLLSRLCKPKSSRGQADHPPSKAGYPTIEQPKVSLGSR